ncbi:hypothetical protein GCM10023228_13890 [Brevibacillus fulvus]
MPESRFVRAHLPFRCKKEKLPKANKQAVLAQNGLFCRVGQTEAAEKGKENQNIVEISEKSFNLSSLAGTNMLLSNNF